VDDVFISLPCLPRRGHSTTFEDRYNCFAQLLFSLLTRQGGGEGGEGRGKSPLLFSWELFLEAG
jgi:hypothetical protein